MRDKLSNQKNSSKAKTAAAKKLSPPKVTAATRKPVAKSVKPAVRPAKTAAPASRPKTRSAARAATRKPATTKVIAKPAPKAARLKSAKPQSNKTARPAPKVTPKPTPKAPIKASKATKAIKAIKVVPKPVNPAPAVKPAKPVAVPKVPSVYIPDRPERPIRSVNPVVPLPVPLPKAPAISKVKPAVVVPRKQIATQALKAFEQAVKAFNLRQFTEARSLFLDLQERYQQEVEIISRSQTYIQVCNAKLASHQLSPRNADEFYDRGVVALNIGDFSQAQALFEKALKLRPDDSYTLYSLAAAHAQSGAAEVALSYLEQAVAKQPRLRHRALNDNDFGALKEDRRFRELLGAESPFDKLEARRDVN